MRLFPQQKDGHRQTCLAVLLKGWELHQMDVHNAFPHAQHIQLNVLVYVDDLIISGNDGTTMQQFKDDLSRCFHMKDLRKLKYFLGIEVARNSDGIFLCQRKYTLNIISKARLLGAKPARTPLEQNHKLALAANSDLRDPRQYIRLVGRLIYLTITRRTVLLCAYACSIHAEPKDEHWEAALRVVRYLKGNPGQGILLPRSNIQCLALQLKRNIGLWQPQLVN
ncbi:hypothetical protein AAG906_026792 [Vitis piasezkii]